MIPLPLFVLAPSNGQSARVAAMLGSHPQGFLLPELNLSLADKVGELVQLFRMAEASSLEDGLLRTVAELFGSGQSEEGVKAAWRWLEWRSDWTTDALLNEFARHVAPRQLVIPDTSSPLRPDLMRRLNQQFPDSRWLHVVRHPRPYSLVTVAEFHDRLFIPPDFLDHNEKHEQAILDPQLFWYRLHITIEAAARTRTAGPGSMHRVRAEAIQVAPELELARLAQWLGWRTDSAAVTAMMHPETSPFAMPGPAGARGGLDREFLDNPEFEYAIRPLTSLDGPLEWRPDGLGFAAEVKKLAGGYGYA